MYVPTAMITQKGNDFFFKEYINVHWKLQKVCFSHFSQIFAKLSECAK